MAIGIPLFILTVFFHAYYIWKFKTVKHLGLFALILIPLSTFIVFDMRHDHLLIHSAIRHIQAGNASVSFLSLMLDRLNNLITGIEFVRSGGAFWNTVVFCIFVVMILMQCKSPKYGSIYKAFLFYFFGFYVLSLINKYPLLLYTFPIFELAFVVFASLITSSYKYVFIVIYSLMFIAGIALASSNMSRSKQQICTPGRVHGKHTKTLPSHLQTFLNNTSDILYIHRIHSPIRQNMRCFLKQINLKKRRYRLKNAGHVFGHCSPPKNNPLMGDAWWKENKLHLSKKPKHNYI